MAKLQRLNFDEITVVRILSKFKFIARIYLFIVYYSVCVPLPGLATNACTDPNDLLSIINRPTVAVSSCVVSDRHLLTEFGFQHRELIVGSYANIYPNTQFRLGVGQNSEIYAYAPVYIDNHAPPFNGNTTMAVGGKHIMLSQDHLVLTLDGLVYPPGGSVNYGFQTTSGRLNGVVSYATDPWNLTLVLSVIYQSVPYNVPNQTYTTFSPDLVLSYTLRPGMLVFGEVYGQSQVGPGLGSGFNVDGGLAFLIRDNITLDIEASSRLTGTLGQFNNYIGFGGTIQL